MDPCLPLGQRMFLYSRNNEGQLMGFGYLLHMHKKFLTRHAAPRSKKAMHKTHFPPLHRGYGILCQNLLKNQTLVKILAVCKRIHLKYCFIGTCIVTYYYHS